MVSVFVSRIQVGDLVGGCFRHREYSQLRPLSFLGLENGEEKDNLDETDRMGLYAQR